MFFIKNDNKFFRKSYSFTIAKVENEKSTNEFRQNI